MPSSSLTTPARLTSIATAKLPRLVLLVLPFLYIVAGLFMRDPWKTDDVVGLATMITTLREGGSTWMMPQVGHLAYAENGPFITWVGGFLIKVFGPVMGDINAGRLANLLWFSIACTSVWYGTYLLGRRKEAQPLALPFGGEPTPRDYGRMIADAALLLLIATVGILQRVHETSEVPAILAFHALVLYSWARMLDRPKSGAITLACAIAASFLSRGWLGALPVMLATLLMFHPRGPLWPRRRWLLLAAALTAVLILAWWIPATQRSEYWTRNWKLWSISTFSWPSFSSGALALRDLSWYLWPTWPLALLAIWRWRSWRSAAHMALPVPLLGCALLVVLISDRPSDADFISLAIPCAVLAAFSLPTLRRGVVNTLDWFSVMVFSLTALTAWVGWIALHFGWPRKIAFNIARQTTDFVPQIDVFSLVAGLLVTAAWIVLVIWRLRVRPQALWRGTVLSAGGLTSTWILLVLLWQPAVDYARSYRPMSAQVARALKENLRPGECVRGLSLGSGQRASLLVFDNLSFTYDPRCSVVLQQTSRSSVRDGTAAYMTGADVLWEGGRPADRHEWYRLLRIQPR